MCLSEINPSIVCFFCSSIGGKTPDVGSRTYSQIMREQQLRGEESEVSGVSDLIDGVNFVEFTRNAFHFFRRFAKNWRKKRKMAF